MSLRVGIGSRVMRFVVSVVSEAWSLKHATTATKAVPACQPNIEKHKRPTKFEGPTKQTNILLRNATVILYSNCSHFLLLTVDTRKRSNVLTVGADADRGLRNGIARGDAS